MNRLAAAALAAITLGAGPLASADSGGTQILFIEQDTVKDFDLVTGQGYQVGTAVGLVSGTSFATFQFTPSGPPSGDPFPITFHNHVVITDLDGDQISFDADGTGSFHLGIPGFGFQGSGGPMRGTYVVTAATGKFSGWKVGTAFSYKAIATSPPSPPGGLGTVYAEIAFRGRSDQK